MADVTEDLRIPSLAQVKTLIDLITASDVGAMPFYKYLSEIGLTAGSETIESIFNAMPVFSMLEINCTTGWTNSSIYPGSEGTLTVYKQELHRATFRFVTADASGVYEGSYSAGWNGWKQVLYADGSVAMTGNLKINKASYPSFVLYSGDSTRRAMLQWNGDAAYLRNQYPSGFSALSIYNDDDVLANRIQLVIDDTARYVIHGAHNKPRGSYTGNGSSTSRTIEIGGISNYFLLWNVNYGMAFVTPGGAWVFTGSVMNYVPYAQCHSENNSIILATTNAMLNTNGESTNYIAL